MNLIFTQKDAEIIPMFIPDSNSMLNWNGYYNRKEYYVKVKMNPILKIGMNP